MQERANDICTLLGRVLTKGGIALQPNEKEHRFAIERPYLHRPVKYVTPPHPLKGTVKHSIETTFKDVVVAPKVSLVEFEVEFEDEFEVGFGFEYVDAHLIQISLQFCYFACLQLWFTVGLFYSCLPYCGSAWLL